MRVLLMRIRTFLANVSVGDPNMDIRNLIGRSGG